MFGNTYVCENTFSTIKQVKSNNPNPYSVREASTTGMLYWQRSVIIGYLLFCNNFNDSITYLPVFNFKYCESVVLYIILLEVSRELSRFCKIACWSKAVGPRCCELPFKNVCILLYVQCCLTVSGISQPSSNIVSELQAHHWMTPEQWTWLLCSVNVISENKLFCKN